MLIENDEKVHHINEISESNPLQLLFSYGINSTLHITNILLHENILKTESSNLSQIFRVS